MAYDRNNIFARILRDEIPSHRVYEDDVTLAFMDVMPQADGHTLVIPKVEAGRPRGKEGLRCARDTHRTVERASGGAERIPHPLPCPAAQRGS